MRKGRGKMFLIPVSALVSDGSGSLKEKWISKSSSLQVLKIRVPPPYPLYLQ